MEYYEVQRLINRHQSSTRSFGHDESDHSGVDYSSDESFDSHPNAFLQHFIPTTTQPRRYYPVPTASPLPQTSKVIKPVMAKRGSSTSLSMKFVQGVHLLKHKVSFLSSSSFNSSHDDKTISEIYNQERIPTVHRLAPPQCSPIPKSSKHARQSSPRWKPARPSAALYGLFSGARRNKRRSRVRKRFFDSIFLKRRLLKSVVAPPLLKSFDTPTPLKVHYHPSKPAPHTLRPASTLIMQLSDQIQRLGCLVDHKVESVQSHQRDILYYTTQLDELNHNVQCMNKKVAGVSIEISTDPIHNALLRTLPRLDRLMTRHHHIVTGFTHDISSKTTFDRLRSEIKSANDHILRSDLITHWTLVGSIVLSVVILGLVLSQNVGPLIYYTPTI